MARDGVAAHDVERHLGAAQAEGTALVLVHQRDDVAAVWWLPTALPRVTVVVATRDRPAELRRCVASILANDYPHFDVVIVDNGPEPGVALQIADEMTGREHAVRCLWEPVPGLARAHNRALPSLRAPIVAFTDDDVVADPRWLHHLVSAFAVAPDVACVTGMIFPLELETAAQELVEQSIGFNKGYRRTVHRLHGDGRDPLFPFTAGQFGSGANMAFRVDALRSFGAFDDALGTGTRARGGDDLAAFFDVVVSGHALVYEPAAIVFHAHRRDSSALAHQAFGYGAGLSAYLTKTLLDRPSRLLTLAARVPAGLRYALAPDSAKNARLPDHYPRGLVWRERAGMVAGPVLYAASRRAMRRATRAPSSPTARPCVAPMPRPTRAASS